MPEICRFYGIVVRMFFYDHPPPHFHAEYAGAQAVIAIHSGAVLGGNLPPRAMGLVAEWAELRRAELIAAWARAEDMKPIGKIDPLP
ncbi:MAG: DUF4160 domain-containing protein [Candidatus Eisenbacteria bacterium]|nr:DUF4160 domain-containing protein [Candidatus Eisenbacteria bacterium]